MLMMFFPSTETTLIFVDLSRCLLENQNIYLLFIDKYIFILGFVFSASESVHREYSRYIPRGLK